MSAAGDLLPRPRTVGPDRMFLSGYFPPYNLMNQESQRKYCEDELCENS